PIRVTWPGRRCHPLRGFIPESRTLPMAVYDNLRALGVTLPAPPAPAAAYVPLVRCNHLVFISGHLARKDGTPWVGQLGKDMTTSEGRQAARGIAIELLGTLHAAIGDLGQVKRIVKLTKIGRAHV